LEVRMGLGVKRILSENCHIPGDIHGF